MALPYPNINPDIFSIGPVHVRWYGLVYVLGLIMARWTLIRGVEKGTFPLKYDTKKAKEESHPVDTMVIMLALAIMLGGRLGFILFYNFRYYLDNPSDIVKVWQGGMSFHGAFLCVSIATFLIARKFKVPFLIVADHLAYVTPMCLGLGRVANFINGELAGRITDAPWGMVFPDYGPIPRHPSQIYEAITEGLMLQIILIANRGQFAKPGRIAGIFVLGYAFCRITVENFREPDAQVGFIFAQVTMGQILSAVMTMFGLWLIWQSRKSRAVTASLKRS